MAIQPGNLASAARRRAALSQLPPPPFPLANPAGLLAESRLSKGGLQLVRAGARLLLGAWLAAVAAVLVLPASAAGSSDLGSLDPAHPIVRWTGGPFSNPGGLPGFSQPLSQVCAMNCERRTLTIAFSPSSWVRAGDGVIIAIHHERFDDALNLYVFDPAGRM